LGRIVEPQKLIILHKLFHFIVLLSVFIIFYSFFISTLKCIRLLWMKMKKEVGILM